MKTVITSTGDHVSATFDLRFGRAAWFCVVNETTGDIEFIQNEFKDVAGGAGTRVAQKMIETGIKKVISGDFGPKAKELLDKFSIQMVIIQDDHQPVQQIIDQITSK